VELMAQVRIKPGICGLCTTVIATSEDEQNAQLKIVSECPNFKKMETELTQADAYVECFAKVGEGKIYETCRKYCKHSACPVPCGIIKAVEVACGLALPKDATIEISK